MSIDTNLYLTDDIADKFGGYSEASVSAPAIASTHFHNTIISIEIPQKTRFTRTASLYPIVNSLTQSKLKIRDVAIKTHVAPKDVSGRVDVTVSWGGSDGVKTEVSFSGSADDDRGNVVEVSATRDSDGKTSVSVSAEHSKDKE